MKILEIIKFLLPFLMSAAEKSFKKLPKEKQQTLINISKLVEIIKTMRGKSYESIVKTIYNQTGLTEQQATNYFVIYAREKGYDDGDIDSLNDVLLFMWDNIDKQGSTGIKGFFSDIVNTLGELVAGIDWKALVLGISEVAFRKYVKGKV